MKDEKYIADLRIVYGIPINEICEKYELTQEYVQALIDSYNNGIISREFNVYLRRIIAEKNKKHGVSIKDLCIQFGATKIQINQWLYWFYHKNEYNNTKYNQEIKDNVIEMKLNGFSYGKINKIVDIPVATMYRWMTQYYKKYPNKKNNNKKYDEETKEKVINMKLIKGLTFQKINEKTNISITTLHRWIKDYCKEHLKIKKCDKRIKYSQELKEKIIQMKLGGITYREIHEMTGVPISTLEKWILYS